MPEIRLEEVSKYYKQENRRIAAVEDINLVIRQGEFVFVTGSSGAGKSTLLQLIHGQLRPDHGSIYLLSLIHIYFLFSSVQLHYAINQVFLHKQTARKKISSALFLFQEAINQ